MIEEISYHLLSHGNAGLLEKADVFDHELDPDQLAAFLEDDNHELVFATIGTRVVGMASGSVLLHPDKKPAFFINEVGVSKKLRRRGIGAELCRKLMRVAREKGCQGIWLATEADNVEARALWQKLKARQTDAMVIYDWDDALDL